MLNLLCKAFLLFLVLAAPFLVCAILACTEPIYMVQSGTAPVLAPASRWITIGTVIEGFWLMFVFPYTIPDTEPEPKRRMGKT